MYTEVFKATNITYATLTIEKAKPRDGMSPLMRYFIERTLATCKYT